MVSLSREVELPMRSNEDIHHSTLEVARPEAIHLSTQQEKELLVAPEKQVVVDDGKQIRLDESGIEVTPKDELHLQNLNDAPFQRSVRSKKKFIIFGASVGLAAVLALVLGLVFGLRHKSSKISSPTTSTNSSSPTNLTNPSSPPTILTNSSDTSTNTTLLQHDIAALSFVSGSVNNTRVYFQDNTGKIIEAANSADNQTWQSRRIGTSRKNGSSISAAVTRLGFPLVRHVASISVDLAEVRSVNQCVLSRYE